MVAKLLNDIHKYEVHHRQTSFSDK